MPIGHLECFENFATRQGKIIYDRVDHTGKKNDLDKIQVTMWAVG